LLENLKLSAQFDRPGEPDLSVLEPYSGARYVAAEEFWIDQFRNAARVGDAPAAEHGACTSVARFVSRQLAEKLSASYNVDFTELIFSCYGALLAQSSGRNEAVVVASLDEKEPYPVLFRHVSELTFAEFAHASSQKLQMARIHRLFAFFILTNPLRLKEFGSTCPSFTAGCLVADSPEITMSTRLEHYPAVNKQIDLLLKLMTGSEGTSFEVSCPTGRHSQAQVEKIAEDLMSAMEVLSASTDRKLNDFVWDYTLGERNVTAAASHQLAHVPAAIQQGS
jgi:hypothetical protein